MASTFQVANPCFLCIPPDFKFVEITPSPSVETTNLLNLPKYNFGLRGLEVLLINKIIQRQVAE